MKAALQDFGLIWRYAVQHRAASPAIRSRLWRIFLSLLIGTAAGLGFWFLITPSLAKSIIAGVGAPAIITAWYGWQCLASGVILYNRPSCAKLVPRWRTNSIRLIRWSWLALTMVSSLFLSMTGGTFCGWALLCGSTLLILGRITHPAWLIPGCGVFWLLSGFGPVPPEILGHLTQTGVLLPSLIGLLCYGYHQIRHSLMQPRAWQTSTSLWQTNAGDGQATQNVSNAYLRALAGDCAMRRRDRLLMHALGPTGYWGDWETILRALPRSLLPTTVRAAPVLALFWLCFIGVFTLLYSSGDMVLLWASANALFAFVSFVKLVSRPNMRQTSAEQKLFRLSPLFSSPRELNRLLAKRLLMAGLIEWAGFTISYALLCAWAGASGGWLLCQLALFSMLLPLVANPLADYSVSDYSKRCYPFNALAGIFLLWGTIILTTIWIMPAYSIRTTTMIQPSIPLPYLLALAGCILANVLLAIAYIAHRWRAMLKAPPAFPVGRFGA